MQNTKTGGRITQLDGLRAIAIVSVYVNHVWHVRLTWIGVDLFFILSGFLITDSLLRMRQLGLGAFLSRFYLRRARRILPPYLLLLILTSIFYGVAWLRHWYMYLFLMNVSRLAHGAPSPEPFSILWSLAIEEQFYLIWPFLVYWCSERVIGFTSLCLMGVAPVLRWTCTPMASSHFYIYTGMPFRMDLLAAGAFISILWRRKRNLIEVYGKYGLALSAIGFAGCLLAAYWGVTTANNTRLSNVFVYELSLTLCTGCFVWALSGWKVSLFRVGLLRYIGRISYSVYLMHVLFLVLAERAFGPTIGVVVGTAVTLCYSTLSWKYLEKPLLAPSSMVHTKV